MATPQPNVRSANPKIKFRSDGTKTRAVVGIHRDDQLVRTGVVAHQGRVRNVAHDQLGGLSGPNQRDAAVDDATHSSCSSFALDSFFLRLFELLGLAPLVR